MEFYDYYSRYMGAALREDVVVTSTFRKLAIHKKYFYPIMLSDYFEADICSCAEEYYDNCMQSFDGLLSSAVAIMNNLDGNFRMRKFERYSYDGNARLKNTAQLLDRKLIHSISSSDEFNVNKFIEENKALFDEGRQFVVMEGDRIASRALVSDIYAGGGNIVVFTFSECRGKGYGSEVVKACVNWCISHDVLPVYFVEANNKASIRLAEGLGFIKKCNEIMIQKA